MTRVLLAVGGLLAVAFLVRHVHRVRAPDRPAAEGARGASGSRSGGIRCLVSRLDSLDLPR